MPPTCEVCVWSNRRSDSISTSLFRQLLDDAFYKEEPLLLQNVARILEAALAENFFGRYRYIILDPPGLGQLTSPWS